MLQNLILALDCASTPSNLAQSKERKGSNVAIWQPWRAAAGRSVCGSRSGSPLSLSIALPRAIASVGPSFCPEAAAAAKSRWKQQINGGAVAEQRGLITADYNDID